MRNKVVAVTGGIGSGKSEVCRYLRSLGYQTLDCDALAREVSTRAETVEQVRKLLGDEYVFDGQLNRAAIRDKVFADEGTLKQYNSIFFEKTKKLLTERLSELNGIVFVEISVFDAFAYQWDEVWLVEADREIRINRAALRDGSARQTVENIVSIQCVCDKYTFKIVNNGNLQDLKSNIDAALLTLNK